MHGAIVDITLKMIQMKPYLLLLPLVFLLLAADQQKPKSIEGRWQWVRSEFISRGMDGPKVSTPKSRKYKVELNVDSENIEIVKNKKSVASVPYLLYSQGEETQIIRVSIPQDDFPFYISSGPIYFRGDTLIIGGNYNDAGEDQFYVKVAD
jgi:hypothetical protein